MDSVVLLGQLCNIHGCTGSVVAFTPDDFLPFLGNTNYMHGLGPLFSGVAMMKTFLSHSLRFEILFFLVACREYRAFRLAVMKTILLYSLGLEIHFFFCLLRKQLLFSRVSREQDKRSHYNKHFFAFDWIPSLLFNSIGFQVHSFFVFCAHGTTGSTVLFCFETTFVATCRAT